MALAVALFVLLVPLYWHWRRRRDTRGWPAWIELAHERAAQYQRLHADVTRRLADIGESCDVAQRRDQQGSHDDALAVLRAIVDAIEAFVPDLVGRLREWVRVAWALERVAPLAPVSPRRLSTGGVRSVAMVWFTLDALLLGARRRFRLRAFMLRCALHLVATSMRDLLTGRRADVARWRRVQALRGDLDTLSHASLDTYRALLVSLQVRRPTAA